MNIFLLKIENQNSFFLRLLIHLKKPTNYYDYVLGVLRPGNMHGHQDWYRSDYTHTHTINRNFIQPYNLAPRRPRRRHHDLISHSIVCVSETQWMLYTCEHEFSILLAGLLCRIICLWTDNRMSTVMGSIPNIVSLRRDRLCLPLLRGNNEWFVQEG